MGWRGDRGHPHLSGTLESRAGVVYSCCSSNRETRSQRPGFYTNLGHTVRPSFQEEGGEEEEKQGAEGKVGGRKEKKTEGRRQNTEEGR